MHEFRPQRLISESSTNSSREADSTALQTNEEQFQTNKSPSASQCKSGFHQRYNKEFWSSQSSHAKPRAELDERLSCSCGDSSKCSERNNFVMVNEKENSVAQDAINTYGMPHIQHNYNVCSSATSCKEVSDSVTNDTGEGVDLLSHNKSKCSSRQPCYGGSNGVKACKAKLVQQSKCTKCHNPHHQNDVGLTECNFDGKSSKCISNMNFPKTESFENDSSHLKNDGSINNSKANCDKSKEVLKERDDIINDYQLQEMMCHKAIKQKLDEDYVEIQKLRKNYSSLKKLFLALATLNIILILCVISVMPVILVTFKLSGSDGNVPSDEDIERISAEHLSSTEAKTVIKEHVLCVDCQKVKEHWSDIFTRKSDKGCCLKDVALLVDRVLGLNEKKLDSVVARKIKHYKYRLEADISALKAVVFKESFKPNGTEIVAIPGRQHENVSRLVNSLLTRKRSAIHLSGNFKHNTMAWTQNLPTTHHLRHDKNAIRVKSSGVYFLYSCIRFEIGQCDRTQNVGYQIAVKHGEETKYVLASIQHPCTDGENMETDLMIQKIVRISVNDPGDIGTTLHVEIEFNPGLVSKNHHHYYGIFEI